MKKKNIIFNLSIICILIIIGQIIKTIIVKESNNSFTIIKGILDLTYVQNTGGAFGLGSHGILFFIIFNIIIIGTMSWYYFKSKNINMYKHIAFTLILSGGIGNLIDRIFRGYVVDYIDINNIFKYPVFNLEDIFIVIGVFILGIYIIKEVSNEKIHS